MNVASVNMLLLANQRVSELVGATNLAKVGSSRFNELKAFPLHIFPRMPCGPESEFRYILSDIFYQINFLLIMITCLLQHVIIIDHPALIMHP